MSPHLLVMMKMFSLGLYRWDTMRRHMGVKEIQVAIVSGF